MVLKLINGFATADGDPMELAMFFHSLLEIFKLKAELDQEKEDVEFLKKFGDFSLADLMKSEFGEEKKEKENKKGDKRNDRGRVQRGGRDPEIGPVEDE